jgi:hypothetical protein
LTWVKLDDRMPEHVKVASLGDRAFRAHIEALCYCAGSLTDGFIPEAVAKRRTWTRSAVELVAAVLWETTEGGWLIHDYLEHQRSKESARALGEVRAKVGAKGGKAAANAKQIAEPLLQEVASRSEEIRSDPNPTDSVTPKRARQKTITDDYRRQMHIRYAAVWSIEEIDERIAEALNHKAVLKAVDISLYVNGWLRRDSERTTGGGAGAQVRGGYGQNRGPSGVARVGQSRRDAGPIDLPPRPSGVNLGSANGHGPAGVPGTSAGGGNGWGSAAGGSVA